LTFYPKLYGFIREIAASLNRS